MGVCGGLHGSKFKNSVVSVKVRCEWWVIVAAYGPRCERDDEEREIFWEKLSKWQKEFDNRDIL